MLYQKNGNKDVKHQAEAMAHLYNFIFLLKSLISDNLIHEPFRRSKENKELHLLMLTSQMNSIESQDALKINFSNDAVELEQLIKNCNNYIMQETFIGIWRMWPNQLFA